MPSGGHDALWKAFVYRSSINPQTSKYPPAKPGALRLLAPQRGLIAIGKEREDVNPIDRIDIVFFISSMNA